MTRSNVPAAANNQHRFRNWGVKQRISVGFGGLILLLAVGMGITLFKLDSVKRTAHSALDERQPAANYFQRLSQNLNQATALINGYLLTGEIKQKTEFNRIVDEISDRLDGARQQEIFLKLGLDGTLNTSQVLLRQFRERADELLALKDKRQINRGLILANDLLNTQATRFLTNINILLNSDDFDLDDPKISQALVILRDLRYNWVRMMWSLSIYVSAPTQAMLVNFNNFHERANILMSEFAQLNVDIGFGEIEAMDESHTAYIAGLPTVMKIFETGEWRADTHLLRTQIQPIVDQLKSVFGDTADELLDAAFDNSEELTHALYQIRISTIVIMVLALLIGTLLAIGITRGIVPPILHLMNAAGLVAEGDLNAEVMVTSKDEIGQLGNSFNAMTNHLREASMKEQQMLDKMQTLNQELETRVENRTKDLEKSETQIRAILENIGEGILVLDETGTIESLNPAAMTIFDLKSDEGIGLHCALLTMDYDADNFAESAPRDNKTKESFSDTDNQQPKEYLGLRSDGSTFPMEIVVSGMLIDGKRMRACIVRDITSRKDTEETLADAQNQLITAAHKSGMADMATGVLHNIGNILNSVNLAGEEIYRITGSSKISGLLKATEMLTQNQANIGEFLSQDARGKKLPEYFIKMGKVLNDEIAQVRQESKELISKTTMMKEVISTQQSYAKSGFHNEQLSLPDLVEDALKIQIASLKKWGVRLDTHFAETPACIGQKSKMLQVITNLIKNAKEAMDDNDQFNRPKQMIIETGIASDTAVYLKIIDNGCGINEEQLTKIFNHGFTTKETGHGFGLHTCANAMTEMKGALKVDSEGVQKGACFTVTLPISKAA